MKKIIVLSLLLFCFALVSEQVSGQVRSQSETLTDAGTTNLDISSSGNYSSFSADVIFTNVSGTSAGWVTLLARNGSSDTWTKRGEVTDGNWINMSSSIDSLAVSDGAFWRVTIRNPAFANYRIRAIGSGTQSTTDDMYYTYKKF